MTFDLRNGLDTPFLDGVDDEGEGAEDAEADSQSYSGLHSDMKTLVSVDTWRMKR